MPFWESIEQCMKATDDELFNLLPRDNRERELRALFEECAGVCLDRVLRVEARLNEIILGSKDTVRLMIASAIAQQPFLMVGPPGVAKTALAVKFYELLGLRRPTKKDEEGDSNRSYFEYLLHSFSVPEEIYGPLDVGALRGESGPPAVRRVNKNMLTGEGVKACFLDEVFKANSAILNTLLTLINERRYFNDSVFNPSSLRIITGACNETPTIKSDESIGMGKNTRAGVLAELWAFYDRWTIRTYMDLNSLFDGPANPMSLRYKIRDAALEQYRNRFHSASPEPEQQLACINDLILLGRCLIPHPHCATVHENTVADPDPSYTKTMMEMAVGLMRDEEHQLCSINPRKILFTEMVSRAHALLDQGFMKRPQKKHLAVFRHIWDIENRAEDLAKAVNNRIDYHEPLA